MRAAALRAAALRAAALQAQSSQPKGLRADGGRKRWRRGRRRASREGENSSAAAACARLSVEPACLCLEHKVPHCGHREWPVAPPQQDAEFSALFAATGRGLLPGRKPCQQDSASPSLPCKILSLSRQGELEYFTVFPVSQYLRCCGAVFQYFRHAKQVFLLQYCMLPAHGPWPSIPISRKQRPSIGGANTSLPRG